MPIGTSPVGNFTVIDCAQHLENGAANPEWIAARLGRVTGSCANDMLAEERKAGKGMRSKLKRRLAMERLTGKPFGKDYQSGAMRQGLDREPEARLAYERAKNVLVHSTGFLSHNVWLAGCSPDGIVGDFEGGLSIKCPEQVQHLEYLRTGEIDTEYQRQIAHEQLTGGFLWHDFVSYNPEMAIDRMRLVIIRVTRNDVELKKHEQSLVAFLEELQAEYLFLRKYAEVA